MTCYVYFRQDPITPEAVTQIQAAAQMPNAACKAVLGLLYENGRGLPQDYPKAKALYQDAAALAPAFYSQLGRMAEEGIGEPVDYVAARRYYEQASKVAGETQAPLRLASLMEQGKGGPKNPQGALSLYLQQPADYLQQPEDTLEALSGIQRLRMGGLALSAEQAKRYNALWVRGVSTGLRHHLSMMYPALPEELKTAPDAPWVNVQLEYTVGSLVPQVSILESSGKAVFDRMVLQQLNSFRFPADPILAEGQNTVKVATKVVLPKSTTANAARRGRELK